MTKEILLSERDGVGVVGNRGGKKITWKGRVKVCNHQNTIGVQKIICLSVLFLLLFVVDNSRMIRGPGLPTKSSKYLH